MDKTLFYHLNGKF